jgi:hypothetical protein
LSLLRKTRRVTVADYAFVAEQYTGKEACFLIVKLNWTFTCTCLWILMRTDGPAALDECAALMSEAFYDCALFG